jgi:hypothetical protein
MRRGIRSIPARFHFVFEGWPVSPKPSRQKQDWVSRRAPIYASAKNRYGNPQMMSRWQHIAQVGESQLGIEALNCWPGLNAVNRPWFYRHIRAAASGRFLPVAVLLSPQRHGSYGLPPKDRVKRWRHVN